MRPNDYSIPRFALVLGCIVPILFACGEIPDASLGGIKVLSGSPSQGNTQVEIQIGVASYTGQLSASRVSVEGRGLMFEEIDFTANSTAVSRTTLKTSLISCEIDTPIGGYYGLFCTPETNSPLEPVVKYTVPSGGLPYTIEIHFLDRNNQKTGEVLDVNFQ